MKVGLVAGGAGFIGSHLCDFLLKKGWRVICVDNLITGRKENIAHLINHPRFKFMQKDIVCPFRVSGHIDVIFNLASPASPRDYFAYPLETMAAGAYGTHNLLEIARKKGTIFIHASTSEVYGDPEEHPQSESYQGNVNPIGPRAVYDESKRYAEALIMTYHRIFHLPVRIARIFNTYGPRMKLNDGRVVPNLIYQALNGQPLTIYGTGKQTRSFCYVSDLIAGLYKMIYCPIAEPVNLGNPQEFTIIKFAQLVKKLTGSKSPLVFMPIPPDDPKRRCPDITRAKRLLKWEPKVNLTKGLTMTIKWFKDQMLI
ncbi:SDR family oxidoreductase [candidate division WOR-3 bacterium]|nr:SDR family oxidoreductase [candidate division WOR-3 bacterium]